MRTNRRSGTTLIEVLVVIVVFLVGILAVVQVFPPGITSLRTQRNNSMATQLAAAEMQRIVGQSGQMAEMILPVKYEWLGSGVRVTVDTTRQLGNLMPPKDPGNSPGLIDKNGQVILNGQAIGDWEKTSGSNLFNRVIGESRTVPAPRNIPGLPAGNSFGSAMTLTFAPAYYFPTNQGIGEDGVVQAYGNDFLERFGSRVDNIPDPLRRSRDYEFYYVDGEDTDTAYFSGLDQIWVGPSLARKYRISFSFNYNNNGTPQQYEVIVQANLDPNGTIPPYAKVAGNYWVVSLPDLLAEQDIWNNASQFDKNNYLSCDPDSIKVERIYQEIPVGQPFNNGDPYQYKVIGTGTDAASGQGFCMGTLLFNPVGYSARVRSAQGGTEALLARVDYTVFDWRIIRDDFRVPIPEVSGSTLAPKQLKLALSAIKSLGSQGPDNRFYSGTGLAAPTLVTLNSGTTDDVVMMDLDTGGVILGNAPGNADSAWAVDKRTGMVSFRDIDGNASNGLSAYICFPTGDPNNPWSNRVAIPDISNRAVRMMYMGRGEWSVQPFKAARDYRVTLSFFSTGLAPGVCYVGGTLDGNGNPIGQSHRLYFDPYDVGQKIVAGELWLNVAGATQPVYDQEFQISGIENVNGVDLAYADVWDKFPGAVFDWTQGYSVRRVKGASLRVRVLWNPAAFTLHEDQAQNYSDLEVWMRNWRKTENEGLQIGGRE